MTPLRKWGAACAVFTILWLAVACTSESTDKAMQQRAEKAKNNVLCGETGESLECKNLREREKRLNQPNAVGYVYEINFDGSTNGYWVIKGKVSSTQSQMAPMDQIIDPCPSGYCYLSVEAAGDDGSYGPNEDGIFFFLANGTMVTYNGIYRYSDKPLPLVTTKQLG